MVKVFQQIKTLNVSVTLWAVCGAVIKHTTCYTLRLTYQGARSAQVLMYKTEIKGYLHLQAVYFHHTWN